MAQFDADINLRVQTAGAEKNIRELERRIDALQKRLVTPKSRSRGPALEREAGQELRSATAIADLERKRLGRLRALTQETDARVAKELRIAAAQQRQATILQALERAGGASTKAGRERVDAAVQASKTAAKSLTVQNAVNVLLEKELQIRREVNRTAAGAAAGQRKSYDYSQQIRALEQLGATEGQLREAVKLRDQLNQQLGRKQIDLSKATAAALSRELDLLEARLQLLAATRAEQQRQTNAYANPIGPNARTSGVGRFGAVSNAEIDAAMVRGMRARREAFFRWESEQFRKQQTIAVREAERAAQEQKRIRENLLKSLGGRLSSGAIGGAFPLLFGQSPQAAVGGAIGGLLGGQAGGFAGSLVGTAIGDLQAAQDKVKELGAELGLSSGQVKLLGEAFQQAGRDADKLEAAVVNIQGLGLSSTETASALKLSSELATEYGGKVDKIAQAFADTLESGKVTISSLNRFTAQGIPIQEELARKYGVSRSAVLQMAKDGKIPVQDLVNVMVKLGRAAEETANKKTAFEQFTGSVRTLTLAVGDLAKNLLSAVLPALNIIITEATKGLNVINNILGAAAEGAKFGLGEAQRKKILTQAQKEAEEIVNRRNIKDLFQRNAVFQQIAAERERDLVRAYGYSTGQLKPEVAGPAAGITPITAPSQIEATDKERREKEKSFYDYSAQNQADLARNAIELSRQVFENEMELARQLYQQKLDYQDKLNKLNTAQLTGAGARDIFSQLAQFQKTQQDYITQTRDLDDKIAKARKDLADARAGVALAGMDATRTKVAGGAAEAGAAGAGGSTRYIDKSVLRNWLISQGFGRTTGDFTNKGHATPNHILNAMDMGILGGSDAEALRRTSDMERKLAATGAFGNQLFGPIRDPYGHGAGKGGQNIHLHIPTPGGKVRLTPGLASLMGGAAGAAPGAVGNQAIAPGGQPNMGGIIGAQGDVAVAESALEGLIRQRTALVQGQEKSMALDMPNLIADVTQGYRDQTLELNNQLQALQTRTRLEMEGVAPEIIEGELSKLEISQQATVFQEGLNKAVQANLISQEKANELLNAYTEAAAGAASAVDALTQAQLAAADPINKLMAQWKRNLTDIRGQYAELAQTVASELGSGMSDAITGVITGTQTVGEAFSRMFANIGKAFIDMATQMIAKALVMKVLGIFAGGIGGGGGGFGGFSGAGPYQFPSMGSYSAGFTGSMNFFAEGGFVTGPTRALIGEGGESEYVIPAGKMGEAMTRYAAGRRGAGVIPDSSSGGGAGGGGGHYTLETVVINNVEYATVEQVRAMGRQSAQQGAAGGHSRVMGDLRNKRSVRSRLGVG